MQAVNLGSFVYSYLPLLILIVDGYRSLVELIKSTKAD